MNRRKGIIALLAGIAAAFGQQIVTDGKDTDYFAIDLTPFRAETGEVDQEATKRICTGTIAGIDGIRAVPTPCPFVQMKYGPVTQRGIEVRLGDRVVRLSAEEIMDALEAK